MTNGEFILNPFSISDEKEFNVTAMALFKIQHKNNKVYAKYLEALGCNPDSINQTADIPFLPIRFFKTHKVVTNTFEAELIFESSGTSEGEPSIHYVKDTTVYKQSYEEGFRRIFGDPNDYTILALLPSYMERNHSSLIHMVRGLIGNSEGGFYLDDTKALYDRLLACDQSGKKVILFGVSFALLDFAKKYTCKLEHTIVLETGGMKGRREELVRQDLHEIIKQGLGVSKVYSEYGMTEILSQAYSTGEGIFSMPPWMDIKIRDIHDPFKMCETGTAGGMNIIDLANLHSCAFIETEDMGRVDANRNFEVLGRMDNSEARGCNLLVAD